MPTPVQRKALPVILSGVDSVVMARTGSGKTCAFLIPVLEKLLATQQQPPLGASSATTRGSQPSGCRVIILSPTRELSLQTLQVLRRLSHFLPELKIVGIHGGEGMEKQFDALARKPDVICATPGRLAHHLTEIPDFSLQSCVMCVLDEADRLFELGLSAQIRQIATHLPAPERCQKVLLSATMPKVLVEFTKTGFFGHIDPPHVVRLDQECQVSPDLRLAFITCRSSEKDAALLHILSNISNTTSANAKRSKRENHRDKKDDNGEGDGDAKGLILVFAATRHHVEYLTALLTASHFSCTMIYGTLDHEARQHNLREFKSGRKNILVVTDVAARGIDVPLIDHVVHYQFPPSPKLFVHRSGRAARGLGRRGYGWALVEPDEMAYMMDLHLFLGRPVRTGPSVGQTSDANAEKTPDQNATIDSFSTYTLDEMTPDMVHYGSVPEAILTSEVENVQRILDSELTGSQQAESLRSLVKVCGNAMKQYRRTRPEPSREGIRRAKAILQGELNNETGERTGGGAIPPHPLLRGWEMIYYRELQEKQKEVGGGLHDLENLQKRQEFLQAMSSFRPKETVFEAFGTGGSKDLGVLSQVDKGRTSSQSVSSTASRAALLAMKNMRRQMKLARNKSSALVVAGSATAQEANGDAVEETNNETIIATESESGANDDEGESRTQTNEKKNDALLALLSAPATSGSGTQDKQRLSKAQRRRLKKDPTAAADPKPVVSASQPKKKIMRGADFRDPSYFIEQDITSNWEEVQQARQREAALQPSGAGKQHSTALRIEEAMMDVMGDERSDLVQKQRMMRWDKSKRKYVATTVGAELSGDSKTKKMRLESGQLVKSDKVKLGDIYEKWQKKTNRSIGRTGVFDDVTEDADTGDDRRRGKNKSGRNNNSGKKGNDKDGIVDEVKTLTSIKKEREKKQNMKLKNMKREDRRRLEKRRRTNLNEKMRPTAGKQPPPKKATKKRK